MKVTVHDPADLLTLRERVRSEADAKQRDRLRAVLLAAEGEDGRELEGDEIANRLGRSPRFCRPVAGPLPKRRPGCDPARQGQRPEAQAAGREAGGVQGPPAGRPHRSRRRGLHAARAQAKSILSMEFGVEMGLSSVYELMHRLNLSCLKPRPLHRKNDPQAVADWLERAPFLPGNEGAAPGQAAGMVVPGRGPHRTTGDADAACGRRRLAAAASPPDGIRMGVRVRGGERGDRSVVGVLAPTVNTDYMNAHLQFISKQVTPGSHGILVLDQAGWHVAKALKVPENLTLLHLPPYSPELNPVERVWQYLRSHYMSNRVFKDYDELFDLAAAAWNRLDQERLKSICHTEWTERPT